jgi:hypothetical protein
MWTFLTPSKFKNNIKVKDQFVQVRSYNLTVKLDGVECLTVKVSGYIVIVDAIIVTCHSLSTERKIERLYYYYTSPQTVH